MIASKTVQNNKIWFEYLPNKEHPKDSHFRCSICYKYFDKMMFPKNAKSSFAYEKGVLKETKKKNTDAINDHAKSVIHLNIIANLKENFIIARKKQRITDLTPKTNYLDITSKMFRTVYIVNKFSFPFSDHEKVVNPQKINGIDLGYHHYDRKGCTDITNHISEQMHEILINNLIKTKCRSP